MTFPASGAYEFELTGTNPGLPSLKETWAVRINVNCAPVVFLNPPRVIQLKANAASVSAQLAAVSGDGLPNPAVRITWAAESGPAPVVFQT
jgi:hypothetical protein